MNEKMPPPEQGGEEREDEHYRLEHSILEPKKVRRIIEEAPDPLLALEKIGLEDTRKRSREHGDPLWADAGNTVLAGTFFLRTTLMNEGPFRFEQALEAGEDLAKIEESIQTVKKRGGEDEMTYITRTAAGELYKEVRRLLLPELKVFIKREIDRLR